MNTLQKGCSRTDENGKPCPGTLGEYRALCVVLAPNSRAVQFLDDKIVEQGADEEVLTPDSQMRAILMPWLLEPAEKREPTSPK